MTLTIRPLTPEEWELFRTVRLKALASDPAVFGRTHAYEAAFTDEEWQARLKQPAAVTFGIFDGKAIVGTAGIFTDPEDAHTACLGGDWLEPAARGKGVSAKMYETRLAWARMQPTLHRLIVAYHIDNARARHIGEKHGFIFTHANDYIRPDGSVMPLHYYELRL